MVATSYITIGNYCTIITITTTIIQSSATIIYRCCACV
nr:MAG TPA: hypothetical protein [Bacteriophage sp.]